MIFLISILIATCSASVNWNVWSDAHHGRCGIVHNSYIWFGTAGGIVKIDPYSLDYRIYNTIDGLGGMEIVSLSSDGDGTLWYGASNGFIGFLSNEQWQSSDQLAQENIGIKKIRYDEGYLWICTDKGLIKATPATESFSIILFNSIYAYFDTFPPEPVVNDVIFSNDSIWVATEFGVFKASKNQNLASPTNWKILPGDGANRTATALGFFHDTLWVGFIPDGINSSLYCLFDTLLVQRAGNWQYEIYGFRDYGDTLWIETKWGVCYYRSEYNSCFVIPDDSPLPGGFAFLESANGKRFASTWWGFATLEDGILRNHSYNTILGSDIVDMDFFGDSVIVATRGKAVNIFHNGQWEHWEIRHLEGLVEDSLYQILRSLFVTMSTVCTDVRGRIWLGSWGYGIAIIDPYDSTIVVWDATNSDISSVPGEANYPVVTKIRRDSFGNMWIANWNAVDTNYVKVWAAENIDEPYNSPASFGKSDSIPDGGISDIECGDDFISIATSAGACVIYHNGTLSYKGDDRRLIFTNSLPNMTVNATTIDLSGRIWFGTAEGICSIESNGYVTETILPGDLSPTINSLCADSFGNVWLATSDGASVFMPSGHFSTFKSFLSDDAIPQDKTPLLDDNVLGVYADGINGEIWFGFVSGLVVLKSPYSARIKTEKLRIWPNPVIVNRGIFPQVRITDVPPDAPLLIYNSAGELVKYIEPFWKAHDGIFKWDGTNLKGESVASGLYFFVSPGKDFVAKGTAMIAR